MIAHKEFAKLRLSRFCPEAEIAELADWEFADRVWVGEAIGFSEWLRPEGKPELLRSLSIDFADFPSQAAEEVLRASDLPLRPGMSGEEVVGSLGKPVKELRFVKDRITYEFRTSRPNAYDISCTVLHEGGLTHLVVTVA
jgi:hypothetical protein